MGRCIHSVYNSDYDYNNADCDYGSGYDDGDDGDDDEEEGEEEEEKEETHVCRPRCNFGPHGPRFSVLKRGRDHQELLVLPLGN